MAKLFDEMFEDDFEKLWAAENAMYIPSYDVEMKYVLGETLNDKHVVDGLMEEIERGDYNGQSMGSAQRQALQWVTESGLLWHGLYGL